MHPKMTAKLGVATANSLFVAMLLLVMLASSVANSAPWMDLKLTPQERAQELLD
jgi:hypothetical protein